MPKAKTATLEYVEEVEDVSTTEPVDEELLEEEEELEENVDLTEALEASLTVGIRTEPPKYKGPRVTVTLPRLEDPGDAGIKVDQYEHVTIANEKGETCYKILRGEPVDIPVPVFMILKQKYDGTKIKI